MQKNRNNEIDFIASHYRRGIFDTQKALNRVRPSRTGRWGTVNIAAAVALIAVIGTTAAVLVRNNLSTTPQTPVDIVTPVAAPETIVRAIDFEDASLPAVVERIEEIYGVEITGIPADADSLTLALHYEGTANDLIETINDILGTQLEVRTYNNPDETDIQPDER